MRLWGCLLFAAGLTAQDSPGIVRGTFLESEGTGRTGQFSLRTPNNTVHRFSFDDHTYVERYRQRVAIAGLNRGEPLEVVADVGDRVAHLRYARIVRVMEADPAVPSPRRRLSRAYHAPTEDIIPRGELSFAGMVLRRGPDSITLRTRSNEIKRILLRPDTRYLHNGLTADAAALAVNTRVFVRAGETFEREIEAYQIMWGGILKPGP